MSSLVGNTTVSADLTLPPILRLPDEVLTNMLARAIWLPGEYFISDADYRGVRPQEYATLMDRSLSNRFRKMVRVSKAFEIVATAALLIDRKPAGLIGCTREVSEPYPDETLAQTNLSLPVPLLWADWMLKFPGSYRQVRRLRLMLREGPLVELDALVSGACEIMARCDLLCFVAVIVRVPGETRHPDRETYERLSQSMLESFVYGLERKNDRMIKLEVSYSYYY